MLSVVKLSDVTSEPVIKLDLPGPLRIGDPLALRFKLRRQTGGRTELLEVDGKFRVCAVGIDASVHPSRQVLSVEAVLKPPTWRSVKKEPAPGRRLGPVRFPRTPVA